jgi:hypothetical protein
VELILCSSISDRESIVDQSMIKWQFRTNQKRQSVFQ